MLVQCPNCKTTYKVSDEVLKGPTAAFRCSRCRHTFETEGVTTKPPAERPKANEGPPPAPEQELSFSFKPPQPADPSASGDKKELPGAMAADQRTDEPATQTHEAWSINTAEAKGETPSTRSDVSPPPDQTKTTDPQKEISITEPALSTNTKIEESEAIGDVLPMSSYMDQRASIFPYLTLFGLLAIVFSLVAALSHAHPKVAEAVVKKIPLLGTVLLKNNHLKDGILIRSARAGYQSIQGNREVFVLTGVASNQNPVVIRQVQITGRVYNEMGKEMEEQTIWLGNTISPKIIRGMTSEDIPHLQNLKPLRSFEIPPGDSVPFTIVFLKATKDAKDFTCEVVAAAAEV
jgi:predicted Zn finger-like uncharacterized protein